MITRTIQHAARWLGLAVLRKSTLERLLAENQGLRAGTLVGLPPVPPVAQEFAATGTGTAALEKLLAEYSFHTVLDVGAGAQHHARAFARHGKAVTAVDFGSSVYHRQKPAGQGGEIVEILGDFNQLTFDSTFDCVWASHVLEHQLDVHRFLCKLVGLVREDGLLAVTVPPLKHEIVGGHVSLWNAGLLLYRLVLAGCDCSEARVLAYGYNISVIVRKRTIPDLHALGLEQDAGDIRKLRAFFPPGIAFHSNELDDPFDGNLSRINW